MVAESGRWVGADGADKWEQIKRLDEILKVVSFKSSNGNQVELRLEPRLKLRPGRILPF